MIVLVKANVLTVGLTGRHSDLKELPVRLVGVETGKQATCSLKNERFDSIVSNWDLPDMTDGVFLKKLRAFKPNIPIIAVVQSGDKSQEIAARSMGASAVLPADASDELFRQTVADILGLGDVRSIKEIYAVAEEAEER